MGCAASISEDHNASIKDEMRNGGKYMAYIGTGNPSGHGDWPIRTMGWDGTVAADRKVLFVRQHSNTAHCHEYKQHTAALIALMKHHESSWSVITLHCYLETFSVKGIFFLRQISRSRIWNKTLRTESNTYLSRLPCEKTLCHTGDCNNFPLAFCAIDAFAVVQVNALSMPLY